MSLRLAWPRSTSRYACPSSRWYSAQTSCSPLAFAFDVDGVLIAGPKAIPAAKRALAMLEGDNPLKMHIPYIFVGAFLFPLETFSEETPSQLTNGGGKSEAEGSQHLSAKLGVKIEPTQYIMAHTILKTLVHKYADSPVLVVGGKDNNIRSVAENYGFRKVYTPLDVLAWNAAIWPFHELTPVERSTSKEANFAEMTISTIMVLHDPRDWGLAVQVMCDIIQSGGVIGKLGSGGNRPVELIFCNPDLIWRNDFERPRFGQGAFRETFQAVYKALTGTVYPCVQYGKPTTDAFEFAEKVLIDRVEQTQGRRYLPRLYMIGDNPASDIAGANAAKWSSVLVRTGVYDPRSGPPKHRPTHETEDVEEAVRWAIRKELAKAEEYF